MSRFLEDEQDDLLDEEQLEGAESAEEEADEDEYLEGEETLEELDTDARGHVRPRRKSRFDEEIEPDYE